MARNQNSNHASQCPSSSSSSYLLPGFSQLDLSTLLPPLPGHTRAPNFSTGSRHNYEYVSAALEEALQISREVEDIFQMIDDGNGSAQGSTRNRSERDDRQSRCPPHSGERQ
jgi:hypothetical protein